MWGGRGFSSTSSRCPLRVLLVRTQTPSFSFRSGYCQFRGAPQFLSLFSTSSYYGSKAQALEQPHIRDEDGPKLAVCEGRRSEDWVKGVSQPLSFGAVFASSISSLSQLPHAPARKRGPGDRAINGVHETENRNDLPPD